MSGSSSAAGPSDATGSPVSTTVSPAEGSSVVVEASKAGLGHDEIAFKDYSEKQVASFLRDRELFTLERLHSSLLRTPERTND